MFVIWTRYERPTGVIVRHAYGPYPTRSKAQTELRRMRREFASNYSADDMARVEAVVTKVITDPR